MKTNKYEHYFDIDTRKIVDKIKIKRLRKKLRNNKEGNNE